MSFLKQIKTDGRLHSVWLENLINTQPSDAETASQSLPK